ncbi:hypothetical protein QLX67_09520 [Balneolaceae bacterium ANBcel3]|nr:hypothetical protein [Balneolaceae bacterium ANBcel3]
MTVKSAMTGRGGNDGMRRSESRTGDRGNGWVKTYNYTSLQAQLGATLWGGAGMGEWGV